MGWGTIIPECRECGEYVSHFGELCDYCQAEWEQEEMREDAMLQAAKEAEWSVVEMIERNS